MAFRPPRSDGGRPIRGYQYSIDGGIDWHPLNTLTDPAGVLSARISGLVNGVPYTVMVRAISEIYTGPGLDARAAVTPAPRPAFPPAG